MRVALTRVFAVRPAAHPADCEVPHCRFCQAGSSSVCATCGVDYVKTKTGSCLLRERLGLSAAAKAAGGFTGKLSHHNPCPALAAPLPPTAQPAKLPTARCAGAAQLPCARHARRTTPQIPWAPASVSMPPHGWPGGGGQAGVGRMGPFEFAKQLPIQAPSRK